MHRVFRFVKVFFFFASLLQGFFAFGDDRPLLSEELPTDSARVITSAGYGVAVRGGLPHQPRFDEHTGLPLLPTVSTPPAQLRFDARIGGGIEASGDAQVYVNSQITQHLIDNSKFKREYESLSPEHRRVLDASGSIIEFETLFKLYEANPSMAELYKENFQRLGNFATRSGNYGHPLAKELAADIEVKSTRKNLGRQIGLYIATPYCLPCAYSTINDEIEIYGKAIEEYQSCKSAYIRNSLHIKQLEAKISTVRSYIEKSESRKCCVCCGCCSCLVLSVAPFVAGAVITGLI